jgi:hypothetical protein
MNRRIAALLVASAILVGAYAAAPAEARTSAGLACTITKTWYEGVTRTGIPRWGVNIHIADNRSAPAWIKAGIKSSNGKAIYTKTKFVQAHGSVDVTLTSPSSTNQVVLCKG